MNMKEMPSQDALILTNVQLKPINVMLMLHLPIHSDLMTAPVMPVITVMAKYVILSMNVMMTYIHTCSGANAICINEAGSYD